MVVTRDSACASPGIWVAIRLRASELDCRIPTTIQVQLLKWAMWATLTNGLRVWINRVYNSRLLLMGLAPLALDNQIMPSPMSSTLFHQICQGIRPDTVFSGTFRVAHCTMIVCNKSR